MTVTTSLLLAIASISFSGHVPPHASNDGLLFQVYAEAGAELPATLTGCGVEDFAATPTTGTQTRYQFAVSRADEGKAQCVRSRLPVGARLTPMDRWVEVVGVD